MVLPVEPEDELLTADQVAEMAHSGTTTVLRWAREGKLPVAIQTPGRRRMFRRSDVERILFPAVDTEVAS